MQGELKGDKREGAQHEQELLDDAIADSFPASDPPSQTSPVAATSSQPQVHASHAGMTGDEVRVYRIIEPRQAAHPFSGPGSDAGGRWTSPRTQGVYASLSPSTAMQRSAQDGFAHKRSRKTQDPSAFKTLFGPGLLNRVVNPSSGGIAPCA